MYSIPQLFDLTKCALADYLRKSTYFWEALAGLKEEIIRLGNSLGGEYVRVSEGVWVHETACVSPTAYLGAPCVIGAGAEIRHGAFIRGSAVIGRGCVVGNSTEIKNSVLFDGAQAPHFNYVGDSILGFKAHFGAGVITANVKADKSFPSAICGDERINTGLKKVGAAVGDFAEVGCNSVLCPAAVLGRRAAVYPLSVVRGTVPENAILKAGGIINERKSQ